MNFSYQFTKNISDMNVGVIFIYLFPVWKILLFAFSFLLDMQDSRTIYMRGLFVSFLFGLGWVGFLPRLISVSFRNIKTYMQIFDFKMLLCREFSKPKFHSMVHVDHRCTLPEVASRTYDELRLDSNESNRSFLYFSYVTQKLLNKN